MAIINNGQLLMEFSKGLLGVVKHLLVTMLILVAYPYLKILGFKTSERKTGSKLLIKEMEQC